MSARTAEPQGGDEAHGRRCAVLGSPIAHSLSPVIHQAAYQHLGLDWTYTANEVDEAGLADFISGLDDRWRGLSLTMPLKRVALDVAADASLIARQVGAANTLVRSDTGEWHATNTDVPGFLAALHERGHDRPASACVWGGGATAASVLAALTTAGVRHGHLHARSKERAREALDVAAAVASPESAAVDTSPEPATPPSGTVEYTPWEIGPACAHAELTVNTAPAGALDALAATLAAAAHPDRILFDVLYDPWPTPAAAQWAEAGGVVIGGLDLLVHQALDQVRLMTGQDVPVAVLRDAAERALADRSAPAR